MSQAPNLIIGRLGPAGLDADVPARRQERGRSSYGISRLGIRPPADEETTSVADEPSPRPIEPAAADLEPLVDEAPEAPEAKGPERAAAAPEPATETPEAAAAEAATPAAMPPLPRDAWDHCRKCTFKLPYELAGRLKHYSKVAGKYQYLVATDAIRRYLADIGPALTYPPEPPKTQKSDGHAEESPERAADTRLPAVRNELPDWMEPIVDGRVARGVGAQHAPPTHT